MIDERFYYTQSFFMIHTKEEDARTHLSHFSLAYSL